jgi:hypothetical protein
MHISKNLYQIVFLLFFVIIPFSTLYSQKPIPKSVQNSKNNDDEKLKKQFIKEQAIASLKDILLNSKSVENLEQKANIVAKASIVLWNYDKPFTENSITTLTTELLNDYESTFFDDNPTEEIIDKRWSLSYSVKTLIRAIAKKDSKLASKFQKQYFKIREKELANSLDDNLNDSLKTAKESEDLDLQQSVNLVSRILDVGIPESFPQYLFDLKKKNPVLAETLLRKAIINLSTNPSYSTENAIILSSFIFNENISLIPLSAEGNDFSLITSPINITVKNSDKIIAKNYFIAYQNFLNIRLQNQANGSFNSPNSIFQNYFLIKKLKKYEATLRFGTLSYFESVEQTLFGLAQNAQITTNILSSLSGYAERLVSNSNPLGLDEGQSAFDKAEKSDNPKEKIVFLVEGIIQMIERRKYVEAEKKMLDIQYEEILEPLRLFLNLRICQTYIEEKSWSEFDSRIKKITDKRIKAFLYLKALSVADLKNNKTIFMDYKLEAHQNLDALSDKLSKASGYIFLASIVFETDKLSGKSILIDAFKAINESDYDQDEFEIEVRIPTRSTYFAEFLGRDAFEKCFVNLAKNDWLDSQIQTIQMKSQNLKYAAQIITAKSVLQ